MLAGGTMEPSDELVFGLQHTCGMPEERLHRFSCDHVVDSTHILPLVASHRPNGEPFDFAFGLGEYL